MGLRFEAAGVTRAASLNHLVGAASSIGDAVMASAFAVLPASPVLHQWPGCHDAATCRNMFDSTEGVDAMKWTPRVGLALCLGIVLSALSAQSAQAFCFSNADCPAGRVCRPGFLGIPVCREIACNFDRDCPRNQRPCAGGACSPLPAGAPGGSTPSGSGTSQAGVGQACGRVQMGGGVVKSVACRRPLQCHNGRCRQPPT